MALTSPHKRPPPVSSLRCCSSRTWQRQTSARLTVAAGQGVRSHHTAPSNLSVPCSRATTQTSLLCRWVLANYACQVAIKLTGLAQAIIKRRASQLPRGPAAAASGAAALAAALAFGPQQLLDVPHDLRAEAQVSNTSVAK